MYVIAIVALVATTAFYRQAKRVGLHPGKAASIPFIAAGIVLGCAYLASLGIAKIGNAANASAFTLALVNFMQNVFLLLAYLTLIRRNWLALLRTPQLGSIDQTDN
jgi:ATP/ADP translocase